MKILRLLKSEILDCDECSLREEANQPVPGIGYAESYRAVVVGQNPGHTEDRLGRPFVGDSGSLLKESFGRFGVNLDRDLYLTNTVHCFTLNTPTKKRAAFCADLFLFREIKKLKRAEFVLLLGATALQAFFPAYKITKNRGQLLRHPAFPDKWFFATYHPAAVLRKPSYDSFFLADLQAFWHFVEHGVPKKQKTKYWIETEQKRINKVLRYLLKKEVISFDMETSGLDPFEKGFYVSMISFSDGPGRAFVIPINHPECRISRKNLGLLKKLLESESVKKIAHNCIFDMKCLKAYLGINVRGMFWDTMLVSYLHYEERKMSSLKNLAAEFTDLGHYEEELLAAVGESKIDAIVFQKAPFDVLAKYAAKDADATFRVYEVFRSELVDESRVLKLLPLLLEVSKCVVDFELEGWFVEEEVLEEVEKKLKGYKKKLEAKISQVDAVIRYEKDHGEINLNSSQQKAVLLFEYARLPLKERTPKGALSTAKAVLATFAGKSKLCKLLLDSSALGKLISTYTKSLFEKRSDDGRLRTTYNLALTGSGRLSSVKPNCQNIPKRGQYAPLIRSQFGSPPGFLLVEGDFSQIELRVCSVYAKEPTMLKAYEKGLDIHRITASALFKQPEEEITKEQRMVGKTANFALIYGISPDSLKERLLVDGDIHISLKQARQIHKAFFEKYPAVVKYHRKVEKFVIKHGYIDTKFGHRRHLPGACSLDRREQSEAFRIAYNHPIQGTSAGILFEALVRVRRAFKGTDAKLLGTVHDSILAYIPEDDAESYAKLLKDTMEDMNYSWLPVPIPVEVQAGPDWSALEEIQ